MLGRLLLALVTAALLLGASMPNALAAAGCGKVASPNGSDSAAGTEAQPFGSVQMLVDSLAAGETGCLRTGTYSGNVRVSRSGAAGAPLTVRSYPGERATIAGKLWITDSADFVTFASLVLDGRNAFRASSPAVDGDDVSFVDNDVTNQNTAICFSLGPTTYGRAYRTVIERNRIHNCGALPATNLQHGIYVEHATGVRIVENVIYDNADRGVQLYPDAQSTYVGRNVIDGNGEGLLIAGGSEDYGPQASNDNLIEHNIITNSVLRNNVESHWGSSLVGQRNVVRQNCIYGGANDARNHGLAPDNGFTASDNLMAPPKFVNRGAQDFRLGADSPCRRLAGDRGAGGRAPTIVLNGPPSARPGGVVRITGRITGARVPDRVTLRTQGGRRWRRLTSINLGRKHRFKLRIRLQTGRRSSTARALGLRSLRLRRGTHVLALRAGARGVGRSNTVRVRIRQRRSR